MGGEDVETSAGAAHTCLTVSSRGSIVGKSPVLLEWKDIHVTADLDSFEIIKGISGRALPGIVELCVVFLFEFVRFRETASHYGPMYIIIYLVSLIFIMCLAGW